MSNYVWIARDGDGDVHVWNEQPYMTDAVFGDWGTVSGQCFQITYEQFPEIKPGECVRFALVRADEVEGGSESRPFSK